MLCFVRGKIRQKKHQFQIKSSLGEPNLKKNIFREVSKYPKPMRSFLVLNCCSRSLGYCKSQFTHIHSPNIWFWNQQKNMLRITRVAVWYGKKRQWNGWGLVQHVWNLPLMFLLFFACWNIFHKSLEKQQLPSQKQKEQIHASTPNQITHTTSTPPQLLSHLIYIIILAFRYRDYNNLWQKNQTYKKSSKKCSTFSP